MRGFSFSVHLILVISVLALLMSSIASASMNLSAQMTGKDHKHLTAQHHTQATAIHSNDPLVQRASMPSNCCDDNNAQHTCCPAMCSATFFICASSCFLIEKKTGFVFRPQNFQDIVIKIKESLFRPPILEPQDT